MNYDISRAGRYSYRQVDPTAHKESPEELAELIRSRKRPGPGPGCDDRLSKRQALACRPVVAQYHRSLSTVFSNGWPSRNRPMLSSSTCW